MWAYLILLWLYVLSITEKLNNKNTPEKISQINSSIQLTND